ncbi:PF06545 family protein [Sinomonas atrocyanea]|uniref:PF06545 family protein n=1 Tax=Sinomonas atrocyanea TaxID=37927 RepID=A0A127A5L8_9MICC|nr:DUF1116 domain-containing protein [Sinomonas atrocyanea]AMM34447.1 PF06545 family protein [Sinomonas atrocyanea]GEB65829.1 hypothetical protein SAT01_32770 [Sinomonas atrocyanea]GGG61131.1 hypothetical protein GCM10007172_10200 [Sinomonas atrocyanea]
MNPNATAADRIAGTEPVWTGMAPLAEVLASSADGEKVLLHAGPPYASRDEVPQPVLNSALQAIIFEGWAADLAEAAVIFASGQVSMAAAQDHGCLVPLAGIISPSMQLHVIEDPKTGRVQHAVLNEGMRNCLRVGMLEPGLVEHQRWLHGPFARWLSDRLTTGGAIGLLQPLEHALRAGDDGHSRTIEGSRLVSAILLAGDSCAFRPEAEAFLADSTPFALNLWMAAAALSLAAAEGIEGSDAVVRVGGNGVEFGFQVAAEPGHWFTVPSTPPRGPLVEAYRGLSVLGAIGDSAVVDFFGLGGAALRHAPLTLEALADFATDGLLERPERVMEREHPRLPTRTGASASRIARAGEAPAVLLGMIEGQGLEGRIGGGIFEPPVDAFRRASARHHPA